MDIQCRLIERIGTRLALRIYWGYDEKACPNSYGTGKPGSHDAEIVVSDLIGQTITDWVDPSTFATRLWPTKCNHCNTPVPEEAQRNRQVARHSLYNTESGKQELGTMWYEERYHKLDEDGKKHLCRWDNCDDPRGHLIVMLPNGFTWDTDSRASNCTMKDDRTHRCWVKHGNVPDIHIDKNGHTCAAGAGSILAGDYHGFLHIGKLVNC